MKLTSVIKRDKEVGYRMVRVLTNQGGDSGIGRLTLMSDEFL